MREATAQGYFDQLQLCELKEHWHVVDAQLRGEAVGAKPDASIAMQRRYALSRMIGHGKIRDEVPLDI
ncbi:hypothetical protein QTI51_31840 [Variovorax sp. J22G73]|uniref:hypothetical protein n=1 Tax=unclassified Variovorax TaxID=663243 RepID=UPI002575EE75|nr:MULTISPECIES: hypothetical protein [unclassified Variovorax]MDM0009402.1 hypothetical protein [Variovorax sp. J22R203]MDM0101909.1 hypothetical protein [Variovorax sp. J22G73]